MSEVFSKLLTDFGVSIGVDDLEISEDNDCFIGVDDYEVNIGLREEDVLFSATFFTIPTENEQKYYKRLITGNFYLVETGGAALSVNPLNNEVQLIYTSPLQYLDQNTFKVVFENFLNIVDHWKEICNSLITDNDEEHNIIHEMTHGIRI